MGDDKLLKIAIVTDGPYGDRAYDTICTEFDCDFVELEPPESNVHGGGRHT